MTCQSTASPASHARATSLLDRAFLSLFAWANQPEEPVLNLPGKYREHLDGCHLAVGRSPQYSSLDDIRETSPDSGGIREHFEYLCFLTALSRVSSRFPRCFTVQEYPLRPWNWIFHCKLAGPGKLDHHGPCATNRHIAADTTKATRLSSSESRGFTPGVVLQQDFVQNFTQREVPGTPAIVSQDTGTFPGSQAFCEGHERHRSTTAKVPALEGSDHQPAATPASSPRRSVAAAPLLREITSSQTPNLLGVISYHAHKMASHRRCPMLPHDSGTAHAMSQAGQKARCLS